METLSIKLNNCYGIDSLDHDFDFKKSHANLIYAPNGVMKTSLAKTFLKISKGESPEEKIYNRASTFDIKIDGNDIDPAQILVVQPFDPNFESKNISTLLVNSEKKAKYDEAYKEIIKAKQNLIVKLNRLSKIKKEAIEQQVSVDLGYSNIFECIRVLASSNLGRADFSEIQYSTVFDEKVVALLSNASIQSGIQDYTARYNELIKSSTLFEKGKFNPINADSISKALKKEKFFSARHKVLLNGKNVPVSKQEDLEQLFEQEKDSILGDGALKEISKKIIGGVASVKSFQEVLEKHPDISAELSDLPKLRKTLWGSYYLNEKEDFDALLTSFDEKKQELAEIENEAQLEDTLWHEAKEIFKARFDVPFKIEIENHTNVILGTKAPNMVFSFKGEDDTELKFNRGQLDSLDFLSVGERRAMYLLYVIFEFKSRIEKGIKTLVIVDDIADSFDYKNKYAIIEFLKELVDEELLRFIVLTHNFDFYRTFQSRILDTAKWNNSYIAQKQTGKVALLKGGSKDVVNPFELWKKNFSKNGAMLVSMIPFVRNLIEYRDGTSSINYKKLTSMLHIKADSMSYTLSDLEEVIVDVVNSDGLGAEFNKQDLVINVIFNIAEKLSVDAKDDEVCLENKVALSIATRLKAEIFMLDHAADKTEINGMQTGKLFDRLCRENDENGNGFSEVRKTLTQVSIMTPENIHLNSFMYEPLMDMSNHHLVELYKTVRDLSWNSI